MDVIRVEVNGQFRELAPGSSVAELLDELDLDRRMIVVELNRNILRRPELEHVQLESGDRIELVHFVGGG